MTRSGRRRPPRGPHAQSGDKGGPQASGSAIERRSGARPERRGPGVQAGLGAGPRGSVPWPPEEPVGVKGRPRGPNRPRGPLLLAPAREEGENAAAAPPDSGAGSEPAAQPAPVVVEAAQAGAPTRAAARRPRLPSPRPRRPLPPSLPVLAPGAQRPPPPEPRAAHEMAPVWPPRPADASGGARARDAPGPAAPRDGLRRRPPARGAVPRTLSGPGRGTAACSGRPTTGRAGEGTRKRTAAAISRPQCDQPARPPAFPAPAPAGGSALNLKIKLVWEGGASAAGGTGCARAAPGRDAASWCQHGCRPFVLCCLGSAGAPRSPEKPASECETPTITRERGPRPGGEVSSSFETPSPPSPKYFNFLSPPRLRPRKEG